MMNKAVVPAKAGTQRLRRTKHWVPAFAGTTEQGNAKLSRPTLRSCIFGGFSSAFPLYA